MISQKLIERGVGVLLLAKVAALVVSFATDPLTVDTARGEVPKLLGEIAEDRELFIISTAFDTFANLLLIPIAAGLYLVFRDHDRALALVGALGFLSAGLLFLTTDMASVAADHLAQSFKLGGAQADSALTSARAIAPLVDAALPMGAVAAAFGVFSFGLLFLRTAAVPRWMGVFGLAAGIVFPFGWFSLLEADAIVVLGVGLSISLFFELVFGSWLAIRGARPAEG